MKKIVLIGAGGLGREVAYMIGERNYYDPCYKLLGFLDDGKQFNYRSVINDYPWLGRMDWIVEHKDDVVCTCCIGNSAVRAKVMHELMDLGVKFETILTISSGTTYYSEIGVGCILSWNSGVSVNCKLGDGVLLNEGVKVGHDTIIGSYTSVMSGTGISGNCQIGEQVEIGGHAYIIPSRKVGDGAKIAAGSVVFANVKAGTTVLGNPAKRMKELE